MAEIIEDDGLFEDEDGDEGDGGDGDGGDGDGGEGDGGDGDGSEGGQATGDRSTWTTERDDDGRIETITYPNGEQIQYGYDDAGKVVSVTDTGDGSVLALQPDGSWTLTDKNGNVTPVPAQISIDQSNGAVIAQINNGGGTIISYPDGSITHIYVTTEPQPGSSYEISGEPAAVAGGGGSGRR